MSDETVRARYMGNPAQIMVPEYGHLSDDAHELEDERAVSWVAVDVEPRHIYELPKSVVAGREDFIIQTDEEQERAVDEAPEKRKGR